MYFVEDEEIAENLQRSLNNNEAYSPEQIVREKFELTDPRLEYQDPTPNIHELFVLFNKRYFWSTLGMVEVKWNHRMTKSAGLCCYQGKGGLCCIKLSAPLLSLRPRKDLVETLLHEMIHAYLFITDDDDDREQHGPKFRRHMLRINKAAGTDISIYHTFDDEIAYYEKHIWRCNGSCQNKRPFYGFVRKTMNKAPGPSDCWWKEHKNNCGGTFIKVSEPQKQSNKKVKTDKDKAIKNISEKRDIPDFLPFKSREILPSMDLKENLSNAQYANNVQDLNDVHKYIENRVQSVGNSHQTYIMESEKDDTTHKVRFSDEKDRNECLRVRATVRNAWANKYLSPKNPEEKPNNLCSPITIKMKRSQIKCPVCYTPFSETVINEHIDECLSREKCIEILNETIPVKETKQGKSKILHEESLNRRLFSCPVCEKFVQRMNLNEHLEVCLNFNYENSGTSQDDESDCDKVPCPCCLKWVLEKSMNDHVKDCLAYALERSPKYD